MTLKLCLNLVVILLSLVTLSETRSGPNSWVPPYDPRTDPSLYNLGVGIYDVTGPAAGVNLMGYANPAQINKGIHIRLFSRAFIMDDGVRRLVFVSVDCGMMSQIIKMDVITRLREEYGDFYDYDNVILSGTHTHSGPAGFFEYLLFEITSLGYIQETVDAMVEGIYQSIAMAHNSMKPGRIYVSSGELTDASINRSPTGYANNPEEEKARYDYDTDKLMTLLSFVAEDGTEMGMVNWYAVHATSMNNTNKLISGDNKGYASQLFEKKMNHGSMPGKGSFVAAFAQSNCGDVSPNTDGPKCQDTGEPCDIQTSTCGGRVKNCYALGPGKDMFESTKIIGEKQYDRAWSLFNSANASLVSGPIQYSMQFVDMSNYTVALKDGNVTQTCPPALGYSFAAGTTDGPGAFDFTQGMTEENPFWSMIVDNIYPTKPDQVICHDPKPVLLDTGNYNIPYPWHPRIMETILGRIGQFFILAVPGEFTTMSGRRIREMVSSTVESLGLANPVPVVAGLSNVYSHYITTREEYSIQRYEGASTIFGPNTLEAYMQQFGDHVQALAENVILPRGPSPPNLYDEQLTLLPGVILEAPPIGYFFGDVVAQPYKLAYSGETVIAKFIAGHPRNDNELGNTFLTVSRVFNESYSEIVATDACWETRYTWERTSRFFGTSEATVYWDVPTKTPEGTYIIHHYGHYLSVVKGQPVSYQGVTKTFKIRHAPVQPRIGAGLKWVTKISGPFDWFKRFFMM